MKKLFIAASFFTIAVSFAQNTTTDKDLMTWYHKDLASTKVYGINTQNAYKFLESKGLKPKTVVVAVLDSGVEVDHPGLKKNIWVNPNEVPNNGKDDDNNGYIDDVHGWNFIGGKNGDVDVDNLEVTRIVRKYKPLFEGEDSVSNKSNQGKLPKEFDMYMKAKEIFTKKSIEAKQNYEIYKRINDAIPSIVGMLGDKKLTPETIASIKPSTPEQAIGVQILSQIANDDQVKGKSAKEVQEFLTSQMKEALDYFKPQATQQYNLEYDSRDIVGDDQNDLYQSKYGNNHYEGPDALHGTHVAGIIAGYPQGNEVQYGVASKVAKIMSVRTVPNGDERDKDVANAIRYAVDNGAKIINMSFGKSFSPDKERVWTAMEYAQDKGVLLVHAAGNDNEDIELNENYPTNFKNSKDEKSFVNNVITVGASTNKSDDLRADFSNFNKKMVDVFAPGDKIYSTVVDGKYKYEQGTSMASPVVAGAAAVLLAYMPTLSPAEIIESLVKTVNKSNSKTMLPNGDNASFESVSLSGGVIDLYKAAVYAYAHFYKNNVSTESKTKVLKRKKVKK